MKVSIGSAVVWLLSSLWVSAGCFLINDASKNTTTALNDVTAMAVSMYDNTSNCSYMVVGGNSGSLLEVYRMTQSEAGLPLFNMTYPYAISVSISLRVLQTVASVCTITSTIYHNATDKFLIAIKCTGSPDRSYLHTLMDYLLDKVNFNYADSELTSFGIGPITRIVPLPNGKVITCPGLVIFNFNQGNQTFYVESIPAFQSAFGYLACIDNDNCMAGTMSSTDLALFNPSDTSFTIMTPQYQLLLPLVGLSVFNTTQVYFVALSDGTYNLFSRQGQLMVSSSNRIFGLPQAANIVNAHLQSTQINGKDAILVGGAYKYMVSGTNSIAFVAGLTVLSIDNNNIEIDIAFSYNTFNCQHERHSKYSIQR